MDRFVSYDTDTAPVIIEPRAAAFLPSIMFCVTGSQIDVCRIAAI